MRNMSMPSVRSILLPLLAIALLTACAPAGVTLGKPQAPYPPPREVEVGDILHLPTGTLVSEAQMLEAVSDARIVYVGETHDNPASHRQQLAVLEAMQQRWPARVAIAMEMFTPEQQPVLDAWVAGELTEKEFLKQSGWYTQWRMDYAYYKPLLEFARKHRTPVIGVNAPKSLVAKVRKTDFAQLEPQQQALLPEIDASDPYQRALVEAIFGGHSGGKADLEGFHRVQTLWDEAMAENIVRYLQDPKAPGMHLAVFAGGNHIRFGFGIPRRVFRRLPVSYALVGSKEIVVPEDKLGRLMDVDIPAFPMPPYHYLLHTEYEDLGREEVKLGVMLEEGADGVSVKGVLPGSSGEKAGLLAGDVIVEMDGAAVKESFDLIYGIKQKQAGDTASLLVQREGQALPVEVILSPLPKVTPHEHKP